MCNPITDHYYSEVETRYLDTNIETMPSILKRKVGGSTRSTEMEDDALRSMDLDSKELTTYGNDDEEGDWGNGTSVARQGTDDCDDEGQEEIYSMGSRENSKRKYMNAEMLSYKQQGSYEIPEDVYAFITVAPVCSAPFLFAIAVIFIKYIVYITLLTTIFQERKTWTLRSSESTENTLLVITNEEIVAVTVKFLLIPVIVAMQEDLMAVYAGLANARYDPKVKEISEAATKTKFALAYLLQLIDGLLSLVVNFFKMFSVTDILDVFLNFAALHFLQDIDDVFYALVEKGFFGDDMEHMATVCKQISWPRRAGTSEFSQFLTNLDSTLFGLTFIICVIIYIVITYILLQNVKDGIDGI